MEIYIVHILERIEPSGFSPTLHPIVHVAEKRRKHCKSVRYRLRYKHCEARTGFKPIFMHHPEQVFVEECNVSLLRLLLRYINILQQGRLKEYEWVFSNALRFRTEPMRIL